MGGEEVRLREGGGASVDANRLHEAEGLVNLCGKLAVAGGLISLVNEVEIPGVEAADVGVTASGEGTENVEGLSTLVVGL